MCVCVGEAGPEKVDEVAECGKTKRERERKKKVIR